MMLEASSLGRWRVNNVYMAEKVNRGPIEL